MTARRSIALATATFAAGLAGCSQPATTTSQAAAPAAAAVAPAASTSTTTGTTTAVPVGATATGTATAPVNGYSCSFPGPGGQSILARFTLDGAGARDDQGMAFTVLANSPTALVMAHPRDDLATTPNGDVGAYVVAIDRRTLGMVQTTMGLNGPGSTRRGRCIAG